MSRWRDVEVQCPFYLSSDCSQRTGYVVRCEGIAEGSKLCYRLKGRGQLETQMETFCCADYEKCEIYRMLKGIWEKE